MSTSDSTEVKYANYLSELHLKVNYARGIVGSIVTNRDLDLDEYASQALWATLEILDESVQMAHAGSLGKLGSEEEDKQ